MESADLTLMTRRLALEPIALKHAQLLSPMMSDPRLTTYLAWAPHRDVDETTRVVESLVRAQVQGSGYHWTIFEGQAARGLISLIDVQRTHRLWELQRAEVAYWVDPEQQRSGIATEAVAAVVACAFERLGLNRLRISHTSANPASGRIPQKLGFRFVGTEQQFFKKNGVWHDMNHYELLAGDWKPDRGGNA